MSGVFAVRRLGDRAKRKIRIRKRFDENSDRLRLSVYRSAKHTYAQVIDDSKGSVVASSSTLDKAVKAKLGQAEGSPSAKSTVAAKLVGEAIAEKLKEKKISRIFFDRNGYLYHGRVGAVAEGTREGGLDF